MSYRLPRFKERDAILDFCGDRARSLEGAKQLISACHKLLKTVAVLIGEVNCIGFADVVATSEAEVRETSRPPLPV